MPGRGHQIRTTTETPRHPDRATAFPSKPEPLNRSWWIGLSREQFNAEAAKRFPEGTTK